MSRALCSIIVLLAICVAVPAGEPPQAAPQDLTSLDTQSVQKLAEAGNAEAQYELGDRYELGLGGLPKNEALARRWYRKAAAQGHTAALGALSALTRKISPVVEAKSPSDAAVASKPETAPTQAADKAAPDNLQQAVDMLFGVGQVVDYKGGRALLLAEVARGNDAAKLVEAVLRDGGLCGFPKDEARARQLAGESLPKVLSMKEMGGRVGMTHAGNCLASGLGTQEQVLEGVDILEQAVGKGDPVAMLWLGDVYCSEVPDRPQQVPADDSRAFELFKMSAEAGCAMGVKNVATCYAYGIGVQRNDALFYQYTMEAAERGSPEGVMDLAHCYAEGRGVRKDPKKALELGTLASQMELTPSNRVLMHDNLTIYRKAARAGDLQGMVNAAAAGLGLARNLDKMVGSGKHKGKKFIGKGSPPLNSFDANNKPNARYFKWAYGD